MDAEQPTTGPATAPRRVFLGWTAPLLPQVAHWLWEVRAPASDYDLGRVLVVVPGRRGARRLLEALAWRARQATSSAARQWTPPTVLTVGSLPEVLSPPHQAVATPLRSLLAWVAALREAPPEVRSRLVPVAPETWDLGAWMALARQIDGLNAELAAAGLEMRDVFRRFESDGEFPEGDRWQALARLHDDCAKRLAAQGLRDLHAARLAAQREAPPKSGKEIVLVALVDLSPWLRRLLAEAADRTTVLVPAPEGEAEAFDPWGCLVVEKWVGRNLHLDPGQIRMVDRPAHQAVEVARVLLSHAGKPSSGVASLRQDEVSVGLGDPALSRHLQDVLAEAGLPSHSPLGRPFPASRPARLLDALARYLAGRRFGDLAALLRHPDVADLLARHPPQVDPSATGTTQPEVVEAVEKGEWLTVLDLYTSQTLQVRIGDEWPGDPLAAAVLRAIDETLLALVPEAFRSRPLPAWGEDVARLLKTVYGGRELDPRKPEEAELLGSLALLGESLREQSELAATDPSTPRVTLAGAMDLTRQGLATEVLIPERLEPGVELLGWLELLFDPAPTVVVTGMNEGRIPASLETDPFLPNHLRQRLGLVDWERRWARDLFLLTHLVHSRRHVTFIASRLGTENEPLALSSLLLARDDEELARMVLRFYDGHERGRDSEEAWLLSPGPSTGHGRLALPRPEPPGRPLRRLPVTAFRDYLRCPYRFYLKRVLKLHPAGDLPREMDAHLFGSLAHEVLRRFGLSATAGEGLVSIQERLGHLLHEVAGQRFGLRPAAAVRVQIAQLRRRLEAFARWQAEEDLRGWRILAQHLEERLQAPLDVDGEVFTVSGQIDRIDHHPDKGYRILDYKTADSGVSPHDAHRRRGPSGSEDWVDLQLPLYRLLAAGVGVEGPVELGFLHLPKELREVGFVAAPWSDALIADAVEQAREVVRKIRRGVFWPPGPAPSFDDGFSWIEAGP